jgi:ankyrin repeat protein
VKLLLEHGADPGDRRGGNTPVERAACDGHDEIIRLLVAAGAKLTDGSDDRRTVLHNAAANGNLKTVKLLLGLGMGLNTMCRDGTPLHAAAVAMDARGAQGGQPVTGAVIRHLLAKGADPNLANPAGEVPVHFATRWPAMLQLLLDHGADPNARKADGTNAVWWATVMNAPESLELLLARGCDPNAVEAAENNSSLDAAIQLKHKKCRALLEAAGALTAADVNACDSGRKLMGKAKAKAKSGSRGRAGK